MDEIDHAIDAGFSDGRAAGIKGEWNIPKIPLKSAITSKIYARAYARAYGHGYTQGHTMRLALRQNRDNLQPDADREWLKNEDNDREF